MKKCVPLFVACASMLYRKGPSNDRSGGLPIVQSGPHRGHEIAKLGFTSTPIANHYMVYGTQITIVYSTMWGPQNDMLVG